MSLSVGPLVARRSLVLMLALAGAACGGSDSDPNPVDPGERVENPTLMRTIGRGTQTARFTAELWVRGSTAYTTTWGRRGAEQLVGNAVYIWDVAGATPALVDSIFIADATTTGDVQVSDDGRLLVVATEREPGAIVIFDLTDPRRPRQIARFSNANTHPGVHTAEVARVNGRLHAFLSVDPLGATLGKLVIVDLGDPASPREVYAQSHSEIIHDVFVRDGILFTALWDQGLTIWDIGGAGRGGSPSSPVQLGTVATVGGNVHNVWWFHDPQNGSKRYAFVGEEGPGAIGSAASGDIHVVDVSDMTRPREVAFFTIPGAGVHNFSVDEPRGILYAAYYNAGVRALRIRGDLSACTTAERAPDGRCDLGKMKRELAIGLRNEAPVFVWGVHFVGDHVYASDMLNGLWKLEAQR